MSDDGHDEEAEVALAEDEERKPGQKFMTPSPGYSDRVFYESLYEQKPESQMAQEWYVPINLIS